MAARPKEHLMRLLKAMAMVDGVMHPSEEIVIRRVGIANGLHQDQIAEILADSTVTDLWGGLEDLPYDEKFDLLYHLLVLMKADDEVMNEEVNLTQKIAAHLGFQLAALMELYPHAHVNVRDPQNIARLRKHLKKFLL